MKKKTETFADLIQQFQHHFDLRTVFDDFLVMALTCLCLDIKTGKSYDEELYMQTIAKYSKLEVRHLFPKMFSCLIEEMEERTGSSEGNDVLGDFYERNFYRKGLSQYFTPWPICRLMASITCGEPIERKGPLHVLEPACGSGRMLLASSRILGSRHYYYGIDLDMTCVRMAAINMFLNGVFHGEIMCANALDPDDFHISYKLSVIPFGIFRITEKKQSPLWHLHRASFEKHVDIIKNNMDEKPKTGEGSQLSFF